jgi:hypothetical protein
MPLWNPIENWLQQGSFCEQVQPPASAPGDDPLVCIQLNQAWIPYVCGALMQLAQPSTWDVSGGPLTLQDVLTEATELIEIVGTATLCGPPHCAGQDPAHLSTFRALTDANSVITALRVSAGVTKGGTAIAYPTTDLALAAGIWLVYVTMAGAVHITAALSIPPDTVLLARVVVHANDGRFHSHDYPPLVAAPDDWFYTNQAGGGPVDAFPSTNPLTLPLPAFFSNVPYNNVATPVASYTGFFAHDPANAYYPPFAPSTVGPVANIASFANPMSTCGIECWTWLGGGPAPGVRVDSSLNGISNLLLDGVIHYLDPGEFPGSAATATTFGTAQYIPHASLGGPISVGNCIALCAPDITVYFNVSTC